MQSRNNQASVDTLSSDSDLVDITSVNVHHEMYDRCSTNCLTDHLAADYVYDDDDDDDERFSAVVDSNVPCQVLLTSDSLSTNGVANMDSPSSLLPLAPFGYPPRSLSEIMSQAVEPLDMHTKYQPEDIGQNNNSFQYDSTECVCLQGNSFVQSAWPVETRGKVSLSVLPACMH